MSKRSVAVVFVLLLSVTLVGSVYAGPRVSGRFSVGSLVVDGTVTNLREHSAHGVTVELDAYLDGTATCGHHSRAFNHAHVTGSASIPAESIHRGQRAEFEIEIHDGAIDEAVDDVCGPKPLNDWQVNTLSATLTLIEGGDGDSYTALGGSDYDHPYDVLDTTSYECRVNYHRPTNADNTRNANCHIEN